MKKNKQEAIAVEEEFIPEVVEIVDAEVVEVKPELSEVEKAAQVLKTEQDRKDEACVNEVNAVLQKHGYEIRVNNQVTIAQKS